MPRGWIPEYVQDELEALAQIKSTLLSNDKTVNLLLQVSQQNNILLARINRLPGVPVSMHIQFQGQAVDQPGVETDVQIITASAVEKDVFDNPTALDVTKLVWAVNNVGIVNLFTNVDGTVALQGVMPGSVQVSVRDIQVGLTAVIALTVSLSKANTIVIQFGTAI